MKQKIIIGASLLLLIIVLILMAGDLFNKNKTYKNPYEYDLGNLRKVDPEQICYSEVMQIKPEIDKLIGLCTDANDMIYVCGTANVFIYDKKGIQVSSFETNTDATCIAVSPDNIIFLAKLDHIEEWSSNGELISSWDILNEKVHITSIAVTDSSVFIADAGNKIVYHYNRSGEFINTIGGNNTINGVKGFIIPSPYFDVLAGRNGEVWAINTGMHSFEAYKHSGELIYSWHKSSMQIDGFSGCCNPSHVAMLSNGSFVTSEKGIERVKIHLPSGEFKCVVAEPDKFIEGTKGMDLAVDSEDRILVLDPGKGMIRIFTEI